MSVVWPARISRWDALCRRFFASTESRPTSPIEDSGRGSPVTERLSDGVRVVRQDQVQGGGPEQNRERRGHPEEERFSWLGAVEQPGPAAADRTQSFTLRPLEHDDADHGHGDDEV